MPTNPTFRGLQFKMTCSAAPEQYDVYAGGVKVGYAGAAAWDAMAPTVGALQDSAITLFGTMISGGAA